MRHSFILLSLCFSLLSFGQGNPVASATDQLVDPFTGDFHYPLSLLNVPGPNGENVPISMNYSAAVRMNQPASWVGLGWTLNPGEISRNVRGVADDWKAKTVVEKKLLPPILEMVYPQETEETTFYGPLYFKDFPATASESTSMDLSQDSYSSYAQAIEFPNYDDYYLSAPGLSGRMQPYLLEEGYLMHQIIDEDPDETYVTENVTPFTKEVVFRFDNEWDESVIDKDTEHPHGARYVEYYTNEQLIAGVEGFIDCSLDGTTKLSRALFDPTGIGAFKVTNIDGMTYHYSLPVYTWNQKTVQVSLDANDDPDLNDTTFVIAQNEMVANSWKLTAITGINYVDVNENGLVDEQDRGYWISYAYKKWADNLSEQFPAAGLLFTKDNQSKTYLGDGKGRHAENKGVAISSTSQNYYLNSISTATHAAYFLKEARDDEYGTVAAAKVPTLNLKKLVLLRKEDAASVFSAANNFTNEHFGNLNNNNQINTATVLSTSCFNEAYEHLILKSVDLTYDYSLAKGYYGNAANTLSLTPFGIAGFDDGLFNDVSATAVAGKLTLKKVQFNEDGQQTLFAPYEFEYLSGEHNPNYEPMKVDYFGHYKKDYEVGGAHYTTEASKDFLDAWSLEKIIQPRGSEISVQYAADHYTMVGYDAGRLNALYNSAYGSGLRVEEISLYDPESEASYSTEYTYDKAFLTQEQDGIYLGAIETLQGSSQPSIFRMPDMVGYGLVEKRHMDAFGHSNGRTDYHYHNGSRYGGEPLYSVSHSEQIVTGFDGDDYVPSVLLQLTINTLKEMIDDGEDLPCLVQETVNYYAGLTNSAYGTYTLQSLLGPCPHYPQYLDYLQEYSLYQDIGLPDGEAYYGTPPPSPYANIEGGCASAHQNEPHHQYYTENEENYLLSAENWYKVSDRSAKFGKLKALKVYDAYDQLLSTTSYLYKETNVLRERFLKRYDQSYATPYIAYSYTKNKYQYLLDKKYVKKEGLTKTTQYLNYDLTGSPRALSTFGGEGSSRTALFASSAKKQNPNNLNLLTLDGVKAQTVMGSIVAGSNTVWSQSHDYLGMASYGFFRENLASTWLPEETSIYNGEPAVADWALSAKISLRDKWEHVLESRNHLNGTYQSSKYGYNSLYKIAEVANANYFSSAYSSFEGYELKHSVVFYDGGFIDALDGVETSAGEGVQPHTGKACAVVPGGTVGPTFISELNSVYNIADGYLEEKGLEKGRRYVASVWMHASNPDAATLKATLSGMINGQPISQFFTKQKSDPSNVQSGDWVLVQIELEVPSDFLPYGGGFNGMKVFVENPVQGSMAYFDDFIVRPVDAALSGFVYDERTGRLEASVDGNGFYTRYEYDAAGRQTAIFKETENGEHKLKQYEYHVAQ